MERMKIVIVGHVDHGKSTLIGRLFYDTDSLPESKLKEIKEVCEALGKDIEFGFVLDHLEEERKQGITIDTTQTFFRTNKREYAIIDAPGHVEFIKNMITGASQAEAAILIVDVTEGVEEQTKRHAFLLSLLGIKQIIVVINKMDLVDYDESNFLRVKEEILSFLKEIKLTPRFIIPISAKEGDFVAHKTSKMNWYKGPTVLEALDKFDVRENLSSKPLRFCVQDVYNFDKRVVVGKVLSGVINKDDEIRILPSSKKTVVLSLEEFNRQPTKAIAGKSTGITTRDKLFIDRGDIIVKEGEIQPRVTSSFYGRIFWLSRAPYKLGERITFKCSTQEVGCAMDIIRVIDSSTLSVKENKETIEENDVADVIIKTDKEVVLDKFEFIPPLGRFVLQREDVVAGGIIINTGDEE